MKDNTELEKLTKKEEFFASFDDPNDPMPFPFILNSVFFEPDRPNISLKREKSEVRSDRIERFYYDHMGPMSEDQYLAIYDSGFGRNDIP